MTKQTDQTRFRRPGRTWITLLLAAVLVGVVGATRYEDDSGMYPDSFWAAKKSWKHNADMVIAGDSRSYIGISPTVMQKTLPKLRIRNFGFNSTGYSAEYLEAIAAVLDPDSPDPRILLCISPFSLTNWAAKINEFLHLDKLNARQRFLYEHGTGVLYFFEPMELKDLWYGIYPEAKDKHFFREHFADGWVAIRTIPDVPRSQLPAYRQLFADLRVKRQNIQRVMDYTSRWRAAGIKVYAVRIPTCVEMEKIENEGSQFNEAAFTAEFEAHGGVWLDFPPGQYESFDHSHLNREGAVEFSRDLAARIRKDEKASNLTGAKP